MKFAINRRGARLFCKFGAAQGDVDGAQLEAKPRAARLGGDAARTTPGGLSPRQPPPVSTPNTPKNEKGKKITKTP